MEPLFYHSNTPGRWGARHEDPQDFLTTARQLGHDTQVTILHISTERRQSAHHIYNIYQLIWQVLHPVANLLIGTRSGERMHFMTYRQYCNKARQYRIDSP